MERLADIEEQVDEHVAADEALDGWVTPLSPLLVTMESEKPQVFPAESVVWRDSSSTGTDPCSDFQLQEPPPPQLQEPPHPQLQESPHPQLQESPHPQLQESSHPQPQESPNTQLQVSSLVQLHESPHADIQVGCEQERSSLEDFIEDISVMAASKSADLTSKQLVDNESGQQFPSEIFELTSSSQENPVGDSLGTTSPAPDCSYDDEPKPNVEMDIQKASSNADEEKYVTADMDGDDDLKKSDEGVCDNPLYQDHDEDSEQYTRQQVFTHGNSDEQVPHH